MKQEDEHHITVTEMLDAAFANMKGDRDALVITAEQAKLLMYQYQMDIDVNWTDKTIVLRHLNIAFTWRVNKDEK